MDFTCYIAHSVVPTQFTSLIHCYNYPFTQYISLALCKYVHPLIVLLSPFFYTLADTLSLYGPTPLLYTPPIEATKI